MESLANYGSDEDQDSEVSQSVMGRVRDNCRGREHEDNYENVGMDMSDEESNNNSSSSPRTEDRRPRYAPAKTRDDSTSKPRDNGKDRSRSREKDTKPDEKSRTRMKSPSDKCTRKSSSDSYRRRSKSKSPAARLLESKSRSDKRSRSPRSDRDYDRKTENSDRHVERKRSRSRERRRSGSRDRKRSSSKDRGYKKGSRSPSRHSRRRSRSRDRRDRSRTPPRYADNRFKSRYDRTSSKLAVLEKLGIEIKTPDCQFVTPHMLMQKSVHDKVEEVKNATGIELPKYYNPAVMNPSRYAEQIQKRRLLWGNKNKTADTSRQDTIVTSSSMPETSTSASTIVPKIWGQTKFNHDNDGKVASKFKRLMGIKDDTDPVVTKELTSTDTLKKQEEMFHSMEAQYEVARAATHTMRGVGLGFGAFAGNFPR